MQPEFLILCEQALLVGNFQGVVSFTFAQEGSSVLHEGRACLLLSIVGLEALIGGDVSHAFSSEGQVVHQVHVVVEGTQSEIFIASRADTSEALVQLRG